MYRNIRNVIRQRKASRTAALRGRRRGLSMFLIAGSMVMIFGFAALSVDFGLLTIDKNRAQRGVDAAALAGAQELTDTDAARDMAIAVAAENGVTVIPAGITFLDDDTKIRVSATNQRNMYFARVIGIPTGTVGASALAGISPGGGFNWDDLTVVPIGITEETVRVNTQPLNTARVSVRSVRVQEEPYELNEFVVYDLHSGASPPQMTNQLINGYTVVLNEEYRSLNASNHVIVNNFEPALTQRFVNAALPPWNDTWLGSLIASVGSQYDALLNGTARLDNPRVVNLVVNPGSPVPISGQAYHEVTATVPVYLEGWINNQLAIRFLPPELFENGGSGSTAAGPVSLLK